MVWYWGLSLGCVLSSFPGMCMYVTVDREYMYVILRQSLTKSLRRGSYLQFPASAPQNAGITGTHPWPGRKRAFGDKRRPDTSACVLWESAEGSLAPDGPGTFWASLSLLWDMASPAMLVAVLHAALLGATSCSCGHCTMASSGRTPGSKEALGGVGRQHRCLHAGALVSQPCESVFLEGDLAELQKLRVLAGGDPRLAIPCCLLLAPEASPRRRFPSL